MDAIDSRILDILVQNGRATHSGIGREVGLSANAVAARVSRLEAAGVIVGYHALLADDVAAPDGVEAFVDVRLAPGRDSDEFLAWARARRSVLDAAHVTGPYDYHLHVRVPDMAALDRLLRSLKRDGGALQTQTSIALR